MGAWEEEKEQLGKEIIGMLYDRGMIRTWYRDQPEGWTLVSGLWSPFYIQLRPLSSYPDVLEKVGYGIGKMLKEETDVNKMVGIAMAGIPLVVAATMKTRIPSCFTRKLEGVKNVEEFRQRIESYGQHSLVEGDIEAGDRLGLVDDLVTRFNSKLVAREQVKYEIEKRKVDDVACNDVAVLFDRQQGAAEEAEKENMRLCALIPFLDKGLDWLLDGGMTKIEYDVCVDYLGDAQKYQDENLQKVLMARAKKA